MEKNKKIWAGVGAVVILVLIIAVGYQKGYRLGSGLSIGKIGTLTMTIPFSETSIFIDQNKKIITTKENEVVKISLSPKTHQIIVSHDGYFPWMKEIAVPSSEAVTLSPIFVSQNASGFMIGEKDSEYWKIKNAIQSGVLPSKEHPKISFDGSTSMWVEDNAIVTGVASTTSTVIQPDTIVKNVDFYKDRSDAVIFSTYNAVYMIETEKEGTQNFMPIYKGTKPTFIKADANSIYIEDGTILMQVTI